MSNDAHVERVANTPAPEFVRLLLASEYHLFAEHLLRLDPLSRYMRFGGQVSDPALRRHVQRAATDRLSIIGYFADGTLRGVVELHPIPHRHGRSSAEVAFSVERGWQGRGVGARLMDGMVAYARGHGIDDLKLVFLATNGRMKRLALGRDAVLTEDADEVTGSLQPGPLTPFAWAREALRGLSVVASAATASPGRLNSEPTPER